MLRARAGCASTRWKSTDRTMRPGTGAIGKREFSPSDSQALAALGATRIDDGTPAARLHTREKPVRACAANFRRLIGAFHVLMILARLGGVAMPKRRPGKGWRRG